MIGKWAEITDCNSSMWYARPTYKGKSYKIIHETEKMWLVLTVGECQDVCAIYKSDCKVIDSPPKEEIFNNIVPLSEKNGLPVTIEFKVFPERNNN